MADAAGGGEVERVREANAAGRERCARCGEERQSHAYVQGVYGALWVCPTAVFAAGQPGGGGG